MGLKQAITDRIRRFAGADEAPPPAASAPPPEPPTPAAPAATALLALWREVAAHHLRAAKPESSVGPALQKVVVLEARVIAAAGAIDAALADELVASLRELTVPSLTRLRERVDELKSTSRGHQRAAAAHQLTLTHLQDEIARCRTMIDQECRRRGLRLTVTPDADGNLHDLLYQVFQAISRAGSRRMQAAGSDPILGEIERLIASGDPAAVDSFPAWLRQPASRVLALVQERNRYKGMLANHGLLPPE